MKRKNPYSPVVTSAGCHRAWTNGLWDSSVITDAPVNCLLCLAGRTP